MSAPNSVCGVCLGSGEVFQAQVAVVEGQYRTLQGFIPCPQCGDPAEPLRPHPSLHRSRRTFS